MGTAYFTPRQALTFVGNLPPVFYKFILIGFVAQLIDGLLGMGYGVVTAISLISLNLNPATVSASIHTAEMFSSGASGYHHYRFGNVNKRLFPGPADSGRAGFGGRGPAADLRRRALRGLREAAAGRVPAAAGHPHHQQKPFRKAADRRKKVKNVGWLAGAGGFLDSFGGGGWGPLVTSTLIAKGRTPQYVIGSVNLTEFFVTFASALTFFATLGVTHWEIVLGLILGGVAAAPLRRPPGRPRARPLDVRRRGPDGHRLEPVGPFGKW